jgi:hypothetical protein
MTPSQDSRSPEYAELALAFAVERRRTRLALGCAIALSVAALLSHVPVLVADARVDLADSTLTLRELVIVDGRGTPRIRLAAPLPDPLMLGRRYSRGEPVSGMLIYDAEGNERGGYVTGDESRTAALTLDEVNRAAIHLGVSDRGEMHLSLSNGQGGYAHLGILPNATFLRLDRSGQTVVVAPDSGKAP